MHDHANLTGHIPLGVIDERVERMHGRGEPLRIIDQFGPALVDIALDAVLFALQAAVLQLLVGGDQRHGTRSLVELTGLDAHQAILDQIDTADALSTGAAVHLLDGLQRRHLATIDLDRHTFLEFDDHFVFDRREVRIIGVGIAILGGRIPRVLKETGLDGATPHILVNRERALLGLHNRQVMLIRIGDLDITGERNEPDRCPCPCSHGRSCLHRTGAPHEPDAW